MKYIKSVKAPGHTLPLSTEKFIPIQASIDEILLDFGHYEPLELLQREGRLMYADYEAWRGGEVDNLDDLLMGDIGEIKKLLQSASEYVTNLGLAQESINYPGWGAQSQGRLEAHSDTQLNRTIRAIWQPPAERPQMDLFMDSPAVSLSNGLKDALANRDPKSARKLLEQLYDVDAGHSELGMFEQLVLAQEHTKQPIDSGASNEISDELEWLQSAIAPVAHEILKRRARDFTAPLWQRLSAALEGQPFSPEEPDLHLSYTAAQSQNWRAAREAIELEPDWQNQPALLKRRMKVCSKLHDEPASHISCFLLCWQFSGVLDAAFRDYPESLLKSEWQAFESLDSPLETDQFPAWLLVRFPALSKSLVEKIELIDLGVYTSYRLVHQLQKRRGRPLDDEQMSLRKSLQKENNEVFQYFMASQK